MEKVTVIPFFKIFFVSIEILLVVSCASKDKLVYFQDTSRINTLAKIKEHQPIYKTDDILSISVSAPDLTSVMPFNLPLVNYDNLYQRADERTKQQTYLIDANGNINFPVLGSIKLEGLNRTQATDLIMKKLKPFVKNARVSIRITNFKVTILGEVRKPGIIKIPNEQVTLPEAIGLAGDLNINGKRKNILVIREIDGVKSFKYIDVTSPQFFYSPYYFLTQNDVVYVAPNRAKINSASVSKSTAFTLEAVSTLVNLLAILRF